VPGLLADAARTWWEGFLPKAPAEQEAYKPPQSQPSAPKVFAEFLDSLPDAPSSEPRLDYLHIIFPHQPWYYLPSGARHSGPFLAPGLMGSTYAWGDDYLAQAGRQRHLLQLVRADQLLGDLLDRMEAAGTLDETLIVITADHGAAFAAGEPIRGVSEANAAQVMWVPLFIKAPGQTTAVIDDTPGRTLDVLPTLATLLGAEVPWDIDGVALDEPRPADVEQRRMLEWAFNALQPPNGAHYVTIDGEAAFADLLALPPATEPGDDPLKPWRFGRWGHLVAEPTDDLRRTEPADLRADLDDPDCARAKTPYADAVPVYICGTIEGSDPIDVIVSVNGYVGGWGRTRPMKQEGKREFFVLVPDDLLDESDDIEVFQAISDLDAPGDVVLAPIALVAD
jgi:hypothetical protein